MEAGTHPRSKRQQLVHIPRKSIQDHHPPLLPAKHARRLQHRGDGRPVHQLLLPDVLLRQRGRQRAVGCLRAEEVAGRGMVHGEGAGRARARARVEGGVGGEEGAVRAFACAWGS